jgi:hypothetical protein
MIVCGSLAVSKMQNANDLKREIVELERLLHTTSDPQTIIDLKSQIKYLNEW